MPLLIEITNILNDKSQRDLIHTMADLTNLISI